MECVCALRIIGTCTIMVSSCNPTFRVSGHCILFIIYSIMIQWGCDTMGVWYNGAVIQWGCDTMRVWYNGGVIQWGCDTMGLWYNGGVIQWGCEAVYRKTAITHILPPYSSYNNSCCFWFDIYVKYTIETNNKMTLLQQGRREALYCDLVYMVQY